MPARTIRLAAWSATSCGGAPVAAPTVWATPPWPSHRSVATGPGLTVLTRMPRGPDFLGQRLAEAGQARLGDAVVHHGRVGQPGIHRAGGDDHAGALSACLALTAARPVRARAASGRDRTRRAPRPLPALRRDPPIRACRA